MMKFAIAGAGAMGCRFGAMLYRSGASVVLLDEWLEHVEAIRDRGLKVLDEHGSYVIPVQAEHDASGAGIADVVIVFTKAMHTREMVQKALPMIGPNTYVMTLQNGLGNIEAIHEFVPRERMIAGVTNFGTELVAPGVIRGLGSGETIMMAVDGRETEALRRICGTMNEAGLNVRIEPNVYTIIWEKVAFNAVYNPLAALTRLKALDIGGYKHFDSLVSSILDEIVEVAKADGVELRKEDIVKTIYSVLDPAMSGEHLTSMLQDVLAKRQTEIAYLNGAIVNTAEQHGIPVPTNALLSHLIRMLETTYEKRVENLHTAEIM